MSSPVFNPFQEAPGGNSLRRSRRRKIPRRAPFAIDGHHVHSDINHTDTVPTHLNYVPGASASISASQELGEILDDGDDSI